jgi:SAM-dependent methyltransferase
LQVDFNDLIHAERTQLLRELPKGAKTFCSAGCSGGWYFDWIEQNYGKVDRHIGIELFLEKPAGLPDNVTWIKNSVADMTDVESASVDLLFSGQNLEHLFYADIQGFLKEASRVVKPGGYLCVDSPNRLVTEELGYIQPQHVLEFTREDVLRLVEAAGFETVETFGIWSCERNGRQFGDVTTISDDYRERAERARNDPDNSFIWWVVARKAAEPRTDLPQVVDSLLVSRFTPFVASRFKKGLGEVVAIEGTDTILRIGPDLHGPVFYGPYVPLQPGSYLAQVMVKFQSAEGAISTSVTANAGQRSLVHQYVDARNVGEWTTIELHFDIDEYAEGVETPVLAHGADALLRFGAHILRR